MRQLLGRKLNDDDDGVGLGKEEREEGEEIVD